MLVVVNLIRINSGEGLVLILCVLCVFCGVVRWMVRKQFVFSPIQSSHHSLLSLFCLFQQRLLAAISISNDGEFRGTERLASADGSILSLNNYHGGRTAVVAS
jgi:hypothetical protein